MLPCFVTRELALEALAVGKAINFIRKVYKVIEEQDDSTASPSDYTIFVRGLPPNATAGAIRDFFSARYDFSSKDTAQPGDVKGLEYPVLGLSVKGVAISSAALVWLDALARDEPDEPDHVSAAGRAHLMMGDLEGARLCFEAAEKLARASDRGDFNDTLARVMCDKGDYLLTSFKFPEAKASFAEALSKNEADATVKINAAVAAVYAGDLDSSRALLEDGLVGAARASQDLKEFDIVSPSAVKNLNSIYELTARTPAESKHSMNVFVKSIAPEDFDVSCMAT